MRNVVIFCDSGPRVGLGHLYRCLPMILLLKKYQIKCSLHTPRDVSNIEKEFKQSLFIDIIPKIEGNSIVILDSYNHNKDWKQLIEQRNDLLFIRFDDRGIGFKGEDLVINSAPNAKSINYKSHSLCGVEYAAISSVFSINKKNKINNNVNSIIVSLGGSDINNQINIVLSYILKVFSGVVYVAGEKIRNIKGGKVVYLGMLNQRQLSEYMKKSDLGIFSGGSTIYQSLCVGLPVIAVPQTSYQLQHAQLWKKMNALEVVDNISNILNAWNLLQPVETRREMSQIGRKLIDGLGAERIVKEIIKINK